MHPSTTHGTQAPWFIVPDLRHNRPDGLFTPEEARALLESWSPATRRALAQLVSISLTVDVPALSHASKLSPIMQPLLDAGLVCEEDAHELHLFDADWGPIPNGLKTGVAAEPFLIGFVAALIAGIPWDGPATYYLALDRDLRLRVFELRQSEVAAQSSATGSATGSAPVPAHQPVVGLGLLDLLRRHIFAVELNSYQKFRQLVKASTTGMDADQLRDRLTEIGRLLTVRLEAQELAHEYVAGKRDGDDAVQALKALRREVDPNDVDANP